MELERPLLRVTKSIDVLNRVSYPSINMPELPSAVMERKIDTATSSEHQRVQFG